VVNHPLIFIYLFILTWDEGILGRKKKEVKMVKLQQFGSLREVKCHFLNTGCQSAIGWIVYGVKCIFPKKKKKKKKKIGVVGSIPMASLGSGSAIPKSPNPFPLANSFGLLEVAR
jgi:hypothetical protein